MITCNLMGGLGNQIFQIFCTLSYAIESKNNFKFLALKKLGTGSTTQRFTFWETFFLNLKPFLINELPPMLNYISENDFTFNELPINKMINTNVMLTGYFQSYKYFEKNYNLISRLVGIEKMKDSLLLKINSEKNFENKISLHFRLGDYKNNPLVHPLLSLEYYELSLKYIEKKNPNKFFEIIYFCENEDLDEVLIKINKLSILFPNYNFKRCEESLEDWEQLLLMSCCRHNIIANSSFSWWGAYFNTNDDKIVCYPSVWFGESANINVKDLCPLDWIKILI